MSEPKLSKGQAKKEVEEWLARMDLLPSPARAEEISGYQVTLAALESAFMRGLLSVDEQGDLVMHLRTKRKDGVTALTFREPNGMAFLEMDKFKGETARQFALAAGMSGFDDTFFGELLNRDLGLLSQIVGCFLVLR